ncbi:MAG: hypothetical protein AAF907_06915, partial [Planctomycetota bacterium]
MSGSRRLSLLPAALCGLGAAVALGFGGCTSGAGVIADADAVEQAGALSGGALTASDWTEDLAAARRQAAVEHKDVLMLCPGADWCHFRIKLEEEVFAQSPASRLTDDFVPVLLDFPRDKALSPAV